MSITSDQIRTVGFIHGLADDAADEIEELEKEVAALKAERERCAKVCIEWADAHAKDTGEYTYENCDFVAAATDCANAIRKGE